MTYCQTSDSHERRAIDLLTVALEKEASAQRLKRMAWDAKATKLLHQTNCLTCKGGP